MKFLLKSRLFYILIGIILTIFFIVGVTILETVKGKRIIIVPPNFNEYPLLDLRENIYKPIYGTVKEVKVYSHIGYVTLTNGTKFSIDKSTENLECSPSQLSHLIQVGDSIAKPDEDFVFFLHRGNICYPFKIKERLRALPVDMSKKDK